MKADVYTKEQRDRFDFCMAQERVWAKAEYATRDHSEKARCHNWRWLWMNRGLKALEMQGTADNLIHPLKLEFSVEFHGDNSAGMLPYSDEITVIVKSGEPTGETGEFEQAMAGFLREWYDGAKVVLQDAEHLITMEEKLEAHDC